MHCHFIMDEFANVSLPDDFDKILSVMRSRGVSVSIILQNLAQLKALFEKQWESIVGNCDEFLYEIVAVFKTVAYSSEGFRYYDFVDAENEEEFNSYVGKCKELALYDTGVTAEYGDRLITLSTCEYSAQNGRLVVVAKKVG